ncbi:acyl-CoA thioesterase [Streptomyces sp. NPDC058412]|uniref:acyl-CoA thioesterase n=1 Tax=Streptomyces sp. NPDC058412 TaxID=3346486 RepID=UPI0036550F31
MVTRPTGHPGYPQDTAFQVDVSVRGYETDAQGHLHQSVYLQYAEHARWSLLRAAGVRQQDLLSRRVGPVVLETTIRYRRELRAGDEVRVTCCFAWGAGRTFGTHQRILTADGTVACELDSLGGLMDLDHRRLLPDPCSRFAELARTPALLGITAPTTP